MNVKLREIEVDAETAEALEARTAAGGITVPELLADMVGIEPEIPPDLEALRSEGRGPWAPEILAEDAPAGRFRKDW